MGYATDFEFDNEMTKEHCEALHEIAEYCFDESDNGCLYSAKWYEHEEDMLKFSKLFPDELFTLSGNGEEDTDIWRKYFKNGKCQVALASITYDEFDEKLLN